MTVNPLNDPPEATDDAAATDEDTPLVIDVLANDTDVEGDPLTITNLTQPANGTSTLNADNTVTYTPNLDFAGTDSFTYTAHDGESDSSEATVTIKINPVNDPPTVRTPIVDVAADEDAADTILDLSGTFDDADGDSLTLTVQGNDNPGLVAPSLTGTTLTLSYVLDQSGTATITIRAADAAGAFVDDDFLVTVTPLNDAPIATDDAYATDEDTPLSVDALSGVLANDTDVEGDSLTATLVDTTAQGTLTLNTDGSFDYTPNLDFNGTDSFTYKAYDGTASSTSATVDITVNPVNDPPVITILEPDGVGDEADASFLITWTDSDADDDALISLYGDRDDTGQDGVLIAEGISEDSPENSFLADTSAVPNGAYFIYATVTDGIASSTSYSAGPLTVFHRTKTIYEDGEDGTTLGWAIFDDDPPGASVANVLDEFQGRVIETSGSSTLNAFLLNKEDDTPFGNTTEFIASWDMKAAESVNFAWRVKVNNNREGILLYGDAFAPGCSLVGTTARCGLDPALYDGLWHTVTRDLAADIAAVSSSAVLTRVDNFGVQGSARVDNVALSARMP